jgi:PAS domain S-box-containing protein
VLTFPLSAGGESIFGFLGFHTVREEHRWSDEIVQRLQLVSQIIENAVVRKRADAALRESEERLQLAADAAEVGMWMLDIEGGRFWTTERARQIFGYSADEDVTMNRFLESVQPSCREPVTEAVRRAVEDGQEIDIEYRIVLSEDGERWVHSRGRMQSPSATSPARLLGASVDVTERKRSQEELQRSYEEVQKLRQKLELENSYLKREHRLQHGSGQIVGESPAIMKVLEMVEQVAPAQTTVLIQGETGTGKELIAQRIHKLSPRGDRPLIKVNCAALPSTLVESELFGREKGAYTGAVSREPGRFEVADGSTIFLDEIAELPIELQSKLLRVLEEGRFERLGSSRTLKTDVRVVAATNRDLEAEVEAGRFRRDLFFRIAVFPIRVPPLRERAGDVPLLVWAMIQELGTGMNKAVETIRSEEMKRLQGYSWPGNVRELRNVVERAMILCNGPVLRIEPPHPPPAKGADDPGVLSMDEVQRRHILKALEESGGQIRGAGGAAELLDMKATTLRSRMERLGLDPRRLRDD